MSSYVFKAETEADRLRLQAHVWEPAAEHMLDQIGVPEGAQCVDLGCGPTGILAPLARRVGASGKVVGVDLLPAQLEAARSFVQVEGLDTVDIFEADVFDTGLPRGAFDLVHGRLLIAPLGRPVDLVREMIALARPGGVVALQEPDPGSWDYVPGSPTWPRLKGVFDRTFARFGGDASAGRRTFALLRSMGLKDVRLRAAVVGLHDRHPYMRSSIDALTAMRKVIVEAGLMTASEHDAAVSEMERIVDDPDTYCTTLTLTQVWGRKPVSSD